MYFGIPNSLIAPPYYPTCSRMNLSSFFKNLLDQTAHQLFLIFLTEKSIFPMLLQMLDHFLHLRWGRMERAALARQRFVFPAGGFHHPQSLAPVRLQRLRH